MFEVLISNVQTLAAQNSENVNTSLVQSGVGKNFISNIRKGSIPSTEKILQLADYFHVSTDYLLGRTDDPSPVGDGKEPSLLRSTLLGNFDQLNQEGQEKLVDTSDDMVSSGKYIKTDPDKLGKVENN